MSHGATSTTSWAAHAPNRLHMARFLPSKMVNVTTIDPARAFTTRLSTFCTPSMAPTLRFSFMVSLGNQESMEPSRRISSEGNLVPTVGVGAKLGVTVLGTAVLHRTLTLSTRPCLALQSSTKSDHPKAAVESLCRDGPSRKRYLGVAVLGVGVLGVAVLGTAVLHPQTTSPSTQHSFTRLPPTEHLKPWSRTEHHGAQGI